MKRNVKKDLVHDMCMLLGIGCGARPDNQYYGDGYFDLNLRNKIKESGFDPKEIEAEAKIEAKKYLLEQMKTSGEILLKSEKETAAKRCPCGGKVKVVSDSFNVTFFIECPDCTLGMGACESESEAISHWNNHPIHRRTIRKFRKVGKK